MIICLNERKKTHLEIIAASWAAAFCSIEYEPLRCSSLLASLRFRMLLMEKLVKLAFVVFPWSDGLVSVFDGLKLDWSCTDGDRVLNVGGVEVLHSLNGRGDGSGLETTSISSSCSWIDIFIAKDFDFLYPKIRKDTLNLIVLFPFNEHFRALRTQKSQISNSLHKFSIFQKIRKHFKNPFNFKSALLIWFNNVNHRQRSQSKWFRMILAQAFSTPRCVCLFNNITALLSLSLCSSLVVRIVVLLCILYPCML